MKITMTITLTFLLCAGAAACGGDDDTGAGEADGGAGDADAGGAPAMPELGAQIERIGRPAINTALNATFEGDAEAAGAAKDAYNQAAPGAWAGFAAEFQEQLAIIDSLDTTCGNQLGADLDPADRYGALAGLLADDQLYVNTASGTCTAYLAVEADALGILPNGDCGGRAPAYDVIDVSYSVLAIGALSGVGDGIDADDAVHDPAAFPFLAAP